MNKKQNNTKKEISRYSKFVIATGILSVLFVGYLLYKNSDISKMPITINRFDKKSDPLLAKVSVAIHKKVASELDDDEMDIFLKQYHQEDFIFYYPNSDERYRVCLDEKKNSECIKLINGLVKEVKDKKAQNEVISKTEDRIMNLKLK